MYALLSRLPSFECIGHCGGSLLSRDEEDLWVTTKHKETNFTVEVAKQRT